MNLLMATGAQALEIALVIRSAIDDGLHMMDEGCYHCSPQPKALLAERMRRDVSVAHLSPSTSISLMLIVATGEMLVVPLHQPAMFLTVACPAVSQIRTVAVSAGAFRFRWHRVHLDFGHEKSPRRDYSLEGSVFHYTFLWYMIPCQAPCVKRSTRVIEGQRGSKRINFRDFLRFFYGAV